MLRAAFPHASADMYASYFHQDWRLDDSSAADVVKRYRRVQSQDEVDDLREELAGLLSSHPSEAILRAELGPFTNYDPAEDGLSILAWTERLYEVLDSPIE